MVLGALFEPGLVPIVRLVHCLKKLFIYLKWVVCMQNGPYFVATGVEKNGVTRGIL
jgi:hypothetical protein